ncbi:MAG: ABC transporter permease [Tissierellia bacterium]|nr:ABC transporter permease [Tissierellia bacterium]
MIFRLFFSTLKHGFTGFWRNRNTATSAIVSNSSVFVILGIITVLILSANNVTREMKSSVNQMQVFLKKDLNLEQKAEIDRKIRNRSEVESANFVSKEQGMLELKQKFGDDAYLLDSLAENPLQDKYIIKLKDISMADSLISAIKEMPEIDEANFHEELLRKIMKITDYIRIGGFTLVLVLLGISVVIISNTTKIAIASRKREINIMKYVGATNEYIKGPFVVEAMIIGALSAILAVLIIRLIYGVFYNSVSQDLFTLFTIYLVTPELLMKDISVIFASIGLGVGAIGSILSLRKHVRV